ncbi:MAG: hypothetical protein COA54_01940 [Thiotrichaceae bacterium]|nr:MAG: hypothetical protein COA54_01940 [Thiotrichaceae bacterium]
MDKMDKSKKAFFLFVGLIMWAGIWLTGFDTVHWILFLPATFFLFSAITGICPGMVFFTDLFKDKQTK